MLPRSVLILLKNSRGEFNTILCVKLKIKIIAEYTLIFPLHISDCSVKRQMQLLRKINMSKRAGMLQAADIKAPKKHIKNKKYI